jgi:type I restriction enzyme R subunit
MVARNRTRTDFLEKFQRLIDEYKTGSANADKIFYDLVKFAEQPGSASFAGWDPRS